MVLIETSLFTRLLGDYLEDEEYRALQNHLIAHPEAGPVIEASRCTERASGKISVRHI